MSIRQVDSIADGEVGCLILDCPIKDSKVQICGMPFAGYESDMVSINISRPWPSSLSEKDGETVRCFYVLRLGVMRYEGILL